jgi:hypothetical protein
MFLRTMAEIKEEIFPIIIRRYLFLGRFADMFVRISHTKFRGPVSFYSPSILSRIAGGMMPGATSRPNRFDFQGISGTTYDQVKPRVQNVVLREAAVAPAFAHDSVAGRHDTITYFIESGKKGTIRELYDSATGHDTLERENVARLISGAIVDDYPGGISPLQKMQTDFWRVGLLWRDLSVGNLKLLGRLLQLPQPERENVFRNFFNAVRNSEYVEPEVKAELLALIDKNKSHPVMAKVMAEVFGGQASSSGRQEPSDGLASPPKRVKSPERSVSFAQPVSRVGEPRERKRADPFYAKVRELSRGTSGANTILTTSTKLSQYVGNELRPSLRSGDATLASLAPNLELVEAALHASVPIMGSSRTVESYEISSKVEIVTEFISKFGESATQSTFAGIPPSQYDHSPLHNDDVWRQALANARLAKGN